MKTEYSRWQDELERSRLKRERAAMNTEYGLIPARRNWSIDHLLLLFAIIVLGVWLHYTMPDVRHHATTDTPTVNVRL